MILIGFTDGGTGNSGTLNITGSAVGSTNEVYLSKHAWGAGFNAMALSGTRVGDGTVALTGLTSGSYYAFVRSKNGVVEEFSIPNAFRVFDLKPVLQERCANAIRDFVMGLLIPGVTTDPELHVVAKVGEKFETIVRGKPDQQAVYYLWAPESYSIATGQEDFARFPVVVSWVMKSSQRLQANKSEITRFRDIIHRSMAICEMNDVPEVYGVSFLPGAVIDPSQWIENSDATTMTINFLAEVQAGIV